MSEPTSGRKFINLEPTASGYKNMKRAMQESINSYQKKLQHIDDLLEGAGEEYVLDYQDTDLVTEALNLLQRSTEQSIEVLQEGITELEKGGY